MPMDLFEAMQTRHSCRAYLPDSVSEKLIGELLAWAGRAPSAINVQPWEFVVVAGAEMERLARRIMKAHQEKQVSCGPGTSRPLPEPWIDRQRSLYGAMKETADPLGLDLNHFVGEGSCRFYGAPVAVLVFLDRLFPPVRMVDIGLALGYFLLAAQAKGLGTCPIGLILAYEDEIKEHLNVREEKQLLLGLALGHPDPQAPINRVRSDREEIRRMVRWIT
jgi:nitroreductase